MNHGCTAGKTAKTLYATVLMCAFSFSATFADTYVLDASLSGSASLDWTVKESYSGSHSRNPTANDTVEIPAGMTAKVEAGSPSWSLINTLARIVPKDGAVFEVDVPSTYGGMAALAVPVTEYGLSGAKNTGTLRKTGGGALELAAYGVVTYRTNINDYYVNIAVDEGDLHLYRDGETSNEPFMFRTVSVAEGATLHICHVGYSRMENLNGKGFVTLDNTVQQRIYLTGEGPSSYSGWMTGNIRMDITAGRHDITCPTNTIATICHSGTGQCGYTRMGADNNVPSSLGTGNFNFANTSGIIYLGEEAETTAKTLWLGADSFIDSGTYGGITFTGQFNSSGESYLHRLTLLGSSTEHPCVIEATFPPKGDGKNVFYVIKKGKGTWRFADSSNRGSLGVMDVEDGTLQFDTIAERGKLCSLGYATNLFESPTAGQTYANGTPVDYAFVLGGDGTTGTLEYTGTDEGVCSTRPIAVRSSGRFASSSARYWFENVYALGGGAHTLALSGSTGSRNFATAISDGTGGGTLDVVKEGEGTWELWGTNTFTGSLVSRGGRMVVWNPEKRYTWFRFTIKENGYGCPTYDTDYSVGENSDGTPKPISNNEMSYIQITEIAVYDADGNNLAAGIDMDEYNCQFSKANGYAGLEPGQVGMGLGTGVDYSFNGSIGAANRQNLGKLFDKNNQVLAGRFGNAAGTGMVLGDESTWVPIVFRLPESVTATAVAMDVASGRNREGVGSYNGRNLKSFRFEGSTDGYNWDMLIDDQNDLTIPESQPKWFSEPSSISYGVRKGKGYAFKQTSATETYHVHSFSAIGAADGGAFEVMGDPLTVSGLVVDATAPAGTLANVAFAQSGTVNVLNAAELAAEPLELPGDYSALDGAENIARWRLLLDGEESLKRVLTVRNGRLCLAPCGSRVILR